MKKTFAAAWLGLSLVMVGVSLAAPPTIRLSPLKNLNEYDFTPMLVPTSTEDVFTTDVYVTSITLTNTTAGDLTITIADKQGTPRNIVGPATVAANTTWSIEFKARYAPSGVTWVASGTGLVGYMRGLK